MNDLELVAMESAIVLFVLELPLLVPLDAVYLWNG